MSSRTPGGTRIPGWIPLFYCIGQYATVSNRRVIGNAQEITRIGPQLGHHRLLLNPSYFICHRNLRRYIICETESVAK
jgi:hypothetical protein